MIVPGDVTLGILAGGQARRLGGRDKARIERDGVRQVDRVLAAWPLAFHESLLSYHGDPHGLPATLRVVADRRGGSRGPVAGLEALALACTTPWLLSVPVDCRELPRDLATRLLVDPDADGASLDDADGEQPLVSLWRVAALVPACAALLDAGDAPARALRARLRLRIVDIAPARLGNLNTPEDLASP
jgi:molybdopterin-guanine dinucleotide biosynthesis protein A